MESFEPAIKTVQPAQGKTGDLFLGAALTAVEAISQARLGNVSEAKLTLAKATKPFSKMPEPSVQPFANWPDWVVAKILIDEAKDAINVGGSQK